MSAKRLIRPPGVYVPQADTALLMDCLAEEELGPGDRTLDLCTGTGVVAIAAARRGAEATAIDISGVALAAARCNARLHGSHLRLKRGDLATPVEDERFDVVTANPPYVPAASTRAPRRGPSRAWDAGPDGRLLLDRICSAVPSLLAPNGVLLLVQSSLAGVEASLEGLSHTGIPAVVVARRRQPFGPVMTARAAWFEEKGLVAPGVRSEELVVIRAVNDSARMPVPLSGSRRVTSATGAEEAA
ncbi:HemK2/MTQ2 family protein methyltransferase [Streptomyces sp. NPDC048629]|uniref:HemK2/MTQ2 family protein methyltransferase n=1 Tax=Streptomyces sp. NPDC048629 TaxID=3154824 RepID=UPI00342AA918